MNISPDKSNHVKHLNEIRSVLKTQAELDNRKLALKEMQELVGNKFKILGIIED